MMVSLLYYLVSCNGGNSLKVYDMHRSVLPNLIDSKYLNKEGMTLLKGGWPSLLKRAAECTRLPKSISVYRLRVISFHAHLTVRGLTFFG